MQVKNTYIADSFWKRLKGLRGTTKGTQLVIPNCRAIHTFGMKHSLQIQCLDLQGNVIQEQRIPPRRILFGPPGTHTIIEEVI